MKTSISKRIMLLAFIILASHGILGYFVYECKQKLLTSEKLVYHTEQVILLSTKILSNNKDLETASLNYKLYSNPTYLNTLYQANKNTITTITQLKQLTLDNPSQQLRVDSLKQYMQKILSYSIQQAQIKNKNVQLDIIAISEKLVGKNYQLKIQEITNSIQQEELLLLKEGKQLNEQSLITFSRISVIMFVLMTILAILLLIVIGNFWSQIKNKEIRVEELLIANKELAFQNKEKQKRADELLVANKELAFQNDEKQKRADELIVANIELAFQNKEKQKRADELLVANAELAFQNDEKQKQAAELLIANKELESFTYISSHDLQEPLRKIQTFSSRIREKELENISDQGKDYFERIQSAASRMQTLIDDLLSFSRINTSDRKFELLDLSTIIDDIKVELKETLEEKNACLEIESLCEINIIPFQFRQLMYNLISNSLKFSKQGLPSLIKIKCDYVSCYSLKNEKHNVDKKHYHISITDNGIGFEPHFSDRIFEVFQKLHQKEDYSGTGIGLAIVKKIVENHAGNITAKSELGKGAQFNICIPA